MLACGSQTMHEAGCGRLPQPLGQRQACTCCFLLPMHVTAESNCSSTCRLAGVGHKGCSEAAQMLPTDQIRARDREILTRMLVAGCVVRVQCAAGHTCACAAADAEPAGLHQGHVLGPQGARQHCHSQHGRLSVCVGCTGTLRCEDHHQRLPSGLLVHVLPIQTII
jgi:hypothetical protein